jgi:S1-C subfamily serine protease
MYGMDDDQQLTEPVVLSSEPPAPPRLTQPPPRRRRWPFAVTEVVVVLAFVATGVAIAQQRTRLDSTRAELDALRTTESSDVAALKKTVTGQQQELASLSGRVAAAQAQLKGAQQRLATDEQQLQLTDQRLPPDLTELAAKVAPSVVFVSCFTSAGEGDSGTAFALDLADGGDATALVTAAHVTAACADPSAGGVIEVSSGSQSWRATVRGEDLTDDVAILDATARIPALKPARSDPTVGEFVMAIGNPLGVVINNVTSGNVSQLDGLLIYDTAPISNGNSGGPVVDKDGDVIGIVAAGATANADAPVVQNLNISVRMSALCVSVLSGAVCEGLH